MPKTSSPRAPSGRTRVRRQHELARYDRASVHAILDAMPLCHVGYAIDGRPHVTPTLQWRQGDLVLWHGSSASRFLKAAESAEVCLTVSIFDGMVLARSGFNHSVNYRSVTLFGRANLITGEERKAAHLQAFMELSFPDRWPALRPMTAQELKATALLAMPIDEASAKVSSGMPTDDEDDAAWPVWAGVIPVRMEAGPPETDPRVPGDIAVPGYARSWKIG